MNTSTFDTGALLTSHFRAKRIRKSALSRVMGCHLSSIKGYQSKPSLQTKILWQLCHALKHNFFRDMADQLPAEFTVTAIPDDSKDRRIAELERQIEVLQAEKAVLLEAIRK